MSIINWYNKKVKKLNVWDIGMIKVYCLLFGMVLGAYIANFVKNYLYYFIAAIVLLVIILMSKVFKK